MEMEIVFLSVIGLLHAVLAVPPVEVSQSKITLLEKQTMTAICRVGKPISYCRFQVPEIGGINLSPSIPQTQGIEYYGAGLKRGECGIRIMSVRKEHNGQITCHIGYPTELQESTGKIALVVAKAPLTPKLKIKTGFSGPFFREGEKIQAECRIEGSRPVANISWFLGSELITEGLSSPSFENGTDGLQTVSQSLTLPVKYTDHGKDLRCVANHIALGPDNINHSIYRLNINFPPKPKSSETEQFGFTIGQPGKVIVMFNANPKPHIHWEVGTERLLEGAKDSTGSFEALVLQNKGSGTWAAVLNIAKVTAKDVEKRYTLVASNEFGRESYKVAISTSPAPPADITAGAIAGIVVAVLIILLIVFILVFARAFGKWCFAAGTNGHKSSSEVAIEDGTEKRPPSIQGKDGVYSSTEYINGNDKKWSKPRRQAGESKYGRPKIGSLTYKNYKPIRIEDGTKIYVSPEDEKKILITKKIKENNVLYQNEKRSRRGSDSSGSAYEKSINDVAEDESVNAMKSSKTCEDVRSHSGEDATPEIYEGRHSYPFHGRKFRLFQIDSPGSMLSKSEVEGGLKLPPHMQEVVENKKRRKELPPGYGLKFSNLFRKSHSNRLEIAEETVENTVKIPEPQNLLSPVEMNVENTEGSKNKEEKSPEGVKRRFVFNRFSMSPNDSDLVKERKVDVEEDSKAIAKNKRKMSLKSIFGIQNTNGEMSKAESLKETERNKLEMEENNKRKDIEEPEDVSEGMESITNVIKFPTSIPLRGYWGPKTRSYKAISISEFPQKYEIKDSASKNFEQKNVEGILSTPRRKTKRTRPVSFAAEPAIFNISSDTESADHGSTDKSSISKLTEEKQQKKFLGNLLDSLRRRNKDKVVDNEALKNLPMTMDKDVEQCIQKDHLKSDGIVYAELDMARSQGSILRRDDEKTEYAEIIHPKSVDFKKNRDDLRRSRENLSSSREHLTEDHTAMTTPDGKKEAAV